jgi:hypothetical protein
VLGGVFVNGTLMFIGPTWVALSPRGADTSRPASGDPAGQSIGSCARREF